MTQPPLKKRLGAPHPTDASQEPVRSTGVWRVCTEALSMHGLMPKRRSQARKGNNLRGQTSKSWLAPTGYPRRVPQRNRRPLV